MTAILFLNGTFFNPIFSKRVEVERLVQDGRVERRALTPSCKNTRITTSSWTIIDRKTLELTRKDTPHPKTYPAQNASSAEAEKPYSVQCRKCNWTRCWSLTSFTSSGYPPLFTRRLYLVTSHERQLTLRVGKCVPLWSTTSKKVVFGSLRVLLSVRRVQGLHQHILLPLIIRHMIKGLI